MNLRVKMIVQIVLLAAWWFNPAIWLLNRAIRKTREDCCDDMVLSWAIATGRAYCDTLYGRYLSTSDKSICLDKTPANGLILPFMQKVFPDAKYVVLTRHPLAIFSSFANSFFDGDYQVAQDHNPILNRYVPAMAKFLRQEDTSHVHVRYEDLVEEPELWMEKICGYIGVPFEKETVDYGEHEDGGGDRKGLGDPIGVKRHSRPSTESINKWVTDLAGDEAKRSLMQTVIGQLDPDDLATWGYPINTLWAPLEEAEGQAFTAKKPKLTSYRLQRKLIVGLRAAARKNRLFNKALRTARLACDVLLRE